jgi:sphingolipid delta-4 desaturase
MAIKTSVTKDGQEAVRTGVLSSSSSAHSENVQRKSAPICFKGVSSKEVHAERRKVILEKHPEILNLYGYDPLEGMLGIATVAIQFLMAYLVSGLESVWMLLLLTYTVSGTLNHSLLLAMHESSHELMFKERWANQLFSVLVNLPMGVPAAAMFKIYHGEHHSGMGVPGVDTDIPTEFEAKLFRGVVGRLIWVMLQPFFYAVRPMVIRPKPKPRGAWAVCAMQILFDIAVLLFLGWKSFFYLFGGSLLGTGLHPMSGHFVAEHFEFVSGQETYSYYGPLNMLTYQVGHHIEHHDFPRIPGSRLPLVRKLAPEYYTMPSYQSWTKVIFDFILGRNMNLYGRVTRIHA